MSSATQGTIAPQARGKPLVSTRQGDIVGICSTPLFIFANRRFCSASRAGSSESVAEQDNSNQDYLEKGRAFCPTLCCAKGRAPAREVTFSGMELALFAFELRRALLVESRDALFCVLGIIRDHRAQGCVFQGVIQAHGELLVHHAFCDANGGRRSC